MPSTKRTNFLDMETILVGSGNQALATGNLVGTGSALGIADGQLGVYSVDHSSATRAYNVALQAGDTAAQVNAIKVVQGTPASSDIVTADNGFQSGHRSHVESPTIYADQIRSVATRTYQIPVNSSEIVHTIPTPQDESLYAAYIKLTSVIGDRDYGDNQDVVYVNYETPDYSATPSITDTTDHLLQNFLHNMLMKSRLIRLPNTAYGYGNKDFIAFGINIAGTVTTGPIIGNIVVGDSIPVIKCGNQTYNYVADTAFVNTVNKWIACGTVTAASTIELIDISVAGTASADPIDAFVVMGLDKKVSPAYDDIEQVKTRVGINVAETFLTALPAIDCCVKWPEEGTNSGRKWYIEWKERARMNIYTPEIFPVSGHFIVEPPSYIDVNKVYTSTVIDFWDYEETMTRDQKTQKQLIILLEGQIDNPGAAANTAFTTSTADSATVTSLNAILGAWLASITNNKPEYLAESTSAAPFV